METNQQPEVEMTPEQMAEQKEKMLAFYKESVPYLTAQLDYEKLLCEIDEVRFKRSSIQYQFAMMMNPSQEESNEETGSDDDIDNNPDIPEQGKRKLKRG
jgi:hypothetical protein